MTGLRRVACVVAVAGLALAASASGASKLSPPVVHEPFTAQNAARCSGQPNNRSTYQMEGCAEHDILRTDATINGLYKQIFRVWSTDSARRDFIAAAKAWLVFRNADCLSVSDLFQGGTEAPVLAAECSADRNRERIKDLRTLKSDLSRTG
jgi:uncharacterized protein YecT (DUF1311 family)